MRRCHAGVATARVSKGKDLLEGQRCHQAKVPEQGIRAGSSENVSVRNTAWAIQQPPQNDGKPHVNLTKLPFETS